MSNEKVRQTLQWLDDEGWSELIAPRWTLEVYHELQQSDLGLTDADIREALDIVIYDKPDYNPANNERLSRGMTEESPKYKEYLYQMQQCKRVACLFYTGVCIEWCVLRSTHSIEDKVICFAKCKKLQYL